MYYTAFITGLALTASLIAAIGAQSAFVLRQGLRREHVPAIVMFCSAMDFILIGVGVMGVATLIGDAPTLARALTLGGALFLLWYATKSFRSAFQPRALVAGTDQSRKPLRAVMVQAAGLTLLNPHVYLDTVLLLGSIGARQPVEARMWFVSGAAVASGAWFSTLGFGARLLAPLFAKARAWQVLDIVVGCTMLILASGLLWRVFTM